jgi:hypothetical protein
MRNMFFPIGEDYYYDSSYERRRNEEMRRRREAEAALRRRAEMEYYQQKQQEQEQQRRRQEVMRRWQEQQEYEEYKQKKHQEMQRRIEEERRIRENSLRQQGTAEPQWEIVRGPDGRLYRVALDPRDDETEIDKHRIQRKQKQKKTKQSSRHLDSTGERDDSNVLKDRNTKQNLMKEIKPRRKRVTIIVEDASDSEMEDELISSPWRNRPPSPGQWIEPVGQYK